MFRIEASTLVQGSESFSYHGEDTGLTVMDFWRRHFSDLGNMASHVCEYLITTSLGIKKTQNTKYWGSHELVYKDNRFCLRATTTIDMDDRSAHNRTKKEAYRLINISKRNFDFYIICIFDGKDAIQMLNIEQWSFYVVPVWLIGSECHDAKSIRQSRLKKMVKPIEYTGLKEHIDDQIERLKKAEFILEDGGAIC